MLVFPLAYYVVRYRRKVVHANLLRAYPSLVQAGETRSIRQIERAYYHHLTDMIAEVIYGYRCSDQEMRERVTFTGLEQMEEDTLRKGGTFLLLGHMGNWEWVADIAKRYQHPEIIEYAVFRQQKSGQELINALRAKRGGGTIDKNLLFRQIIRIRQQGIKATFGMLSDQKPSKQGLRFWTMFLGQDTPFINGAEVLAKRFDYAVYFVSVKQTKRGYYQCSVDLITHDAPATEEGDITEQYARLLEKNIQTQPTQWLWSHNRWKWQRSDVQ